MVYLFAAVIVVLLGVVAVVASGRGGYLADVYDDRPDVRVPADRPLVSSDLRRLRFSTAFRGYRMSEVDALLDRLAAELPPERDAGGAVEHPATPDEGGEPDDASPDQC